MQEMNFKNEELDIEINSYINKNNEIWFHGKEIALTLGYKKPRNAISTHVHEDDKKIMDFKIQTHVKSHNSRGQKKRRRAESYEKTFKCYFINESGFYSLIFSSKLPVSMKFKHWVTSKVLPSIRKRGYYDFRNKSLIIDTEYDLHTKVVSFIRDKYPETLMIAGLGENQTTSDLRIESWKKGYMAGQCDLMIMNPTSKHNSLCIEFKDPKGNSQLSEKQIEMKQKYVNNKCRYIMSNCFTDIIYEIIKHMDESNRYLRNRLKRNA